MTFEQWAGKHCQTFGLLDPSEFAMVLSWRVPLCDLSGYSVDELESATAWMAAKAAPKFRTDHLRLIQERVSSARLAASAAEARKRIEASGGEDKGRCSLCGNSGFAIVPHIDLVRDGTWVRPWNTMALPCKCGVGRHIVATDSAAEAKRVATENEKGRAGKSTQRMTLAAYEFVNPLWQGQMDDQKRQRDAIDAAESAARHADKTRGPLAKDIDKIIGRVRSPGGMACDLEGATV